MVGTSIAVEFGKTQLFEQVIHTKGATICAPVVLNMCPKLGRNEVCAEGKWTFWRISPVRPAQTHRCLLWISAGAMLGLGDRYGSCTSEGGGEAAPRSRLGWCDSSAFTTPFGSQLVGWKKGTFLEGPWKGASQMVSWCFFYGNPKHSKTMVKSLDRSLVWYRRSDK